MEFSFTLADKIDPVAIYAALVATIVLLWDVIKWWRQGPRLQGSAVPDMIVIGGHPEDRNTYISFSVSNVGSAPTTIKTVGLVAYRRPSWMLPRKQAEGAHIRHGYPGYELPCLLAPGAEFRSRVIQQPMIEEWSRKYWLYGAIYHSVSRKPTLLRIKPITGSVSAARRQLGDHVNEHPT